jgi:diamine N-acetyltransferase
MVYLENINEDNFYKLVNMKKQNHVAPNVYSIAQAYVSPKGRPKAILNQEKEVVGFVMYGLDGDDELWIWRLSIDTPYQRKGYGKAAVKEVIKNVLKEYPEEAELWLGTSPENERAIKLYTSLGFKDSGKTAYDDEKVFVYNLK